MATKLHFDLNDTELANFLAMQESQWILPAQQAHERTADLLRNGIQNTGLTLPWMKTHEQFRLRMGEVSIIAGINGHGKSQCSGMIANWLAPEVNICIASMEMLPETTFARMIKQSAGNGQPAQRFIDSWFRWSDGRVYYYDQLDTVSPARILAMIHHAALKADCKLIVIDSLIKCIRGSDSYNEQKDFVDSIARIAKAHRIHIILVHHIRKSDDELKMPDKFDLRGAGEISDLVDNVLILFRNKSKERRIESGEEVDMFEPDALLGVVKQRHGNWEGRIKLWFDPSSEQYIPRPDRGALPWPNADEYHSFIRDYGDEHEH